jgi:L-asparagine transporter-like permease
MMQIPEVRHRWYRLWSMRFILVTTLLSSADAIFMELPTEWQLDIPNWIVKVCAFVTAVTAGLAGVSRLRE